MDQVFSLREFAVWLLTGGGSGAVVFWLMDNVPFLAGILPDYKRWATFALTAVVATGTWLFCMWMGWVGVPASPQGWVESALSVIGTAIITGQVIHGATSLRKRRLSMTD